MKHVLVAIPYKETLHRVLYRRMMELSDRLIDANPDYEIEIVRICDKFVFTGEEPYSFPQATARNALLAAYLKPEHDLVMWIDADIVDYPADIITVLDNANPGGVTAPMVLIEGTVQFYDTYGYRQNGNPISHIPPYFNPFEQLTEIDAVGCAYLIPASVYKDDRYTCTPGQTEHYSIMQVAKAAGMKVACFTDMVIYHAYLPKYGEYFHGH